MKTEVFSVKHTRPVVNKDGCITYKEVNGSVSIDPDNGSITLEDTDGSRTEVRINPLIINWVFTTLQNSENRAKELHELRIKEAAAHAEEATARAEEAQLRHQIEMTGLQKNLLLARRELREMFPNRKKKNCNKKQQH